MVQPFFTAPGSNRTAERLLLISYHFPPEQTAGALRWQKLAKYAAEWGYGLDVLTLDPSALTSADHSRLRELPPGTRVFGIAEPRSPLERLEQLASAGLRRLRSVCTTRAPAANERGEGAANPVPGSLSREEVHWRPFSTRDTVRAYFAAREYLMHRSWAKQAAEVGAKLASQQPYAAVVSCGPPHMAHEGARRLSVRAGLPLIMDLRDPWSLWQRLPESIASPLWFRLADRYERRAVKHAALVVMNTLPACRAMQGRYPEAAERIIAVMNGYDDDPAPHAEPSARFTIAHAGSIYIDRDPRPLFRAAARVIRELAIEPHAFGIELMGDMGSAHERIEDIATEEGIAEFVRVHPLRPRQEALAFLAGATLLVVLPQDSDLAIPSKIFEYMQFDAWILALAQRGSAVEMTFRNAGIDVVPPDDLPGLAATLRERYLQHARGIRPARPSSRERFSRRAQAQLLFAALESRLAGTSPADAPQQTTLQLRPSAP